MQALRLSSSPTEGASTIITMRGEERASKAMMRTPEKRALRQHPRRQMQEVCLEDVSGRLPLPAGLLLLAANWQLTAMSVTEANEWCYDMIIALLPKHLIGHEPQTVDPALLLRDDHGQVLRAAWTNLRVRRAFLRA